MFYTNYFFDIINLVNYMKKKYYFFKMNDKAISVLPLIILLVEVAVIYLVDKSLLSDMLKCFNDDPALLIVLYLAYCALHEFFHSLAYIVHRIPFDKITYGIALEKGVFYCLCKQNIKRNMILRSLLYPFFFLGVVTLVIGIVCDIPMLTLLSLANITGCSGDIVMFIFILKFSKDVEFSEFDSEISFALYSDKDLSKVKQYGIDYIECKDTIKREDLKKVKVSKHSLLALLVIAVLFILYEVFVNG